MSNAKVRKRKMLSVEILKENLHYDPKTGIFICIKDRGSKSKEGSIVGSKTYDGYIVIGINNISYPAHRLAWLYMTGEMPKGLIDHKNGDKTDNRFDNLRECTHSQNLQNLRKANNGNMSGLLGVTHHKNGKYKARIFTNGKRKYLGLFLSPQEAHEAYLTAKRELHEFCTI